MGALVRDNDILFLANHGVVVTAESVAVAFDDLYYLERACMIQVLAESRGQPLKLVSDDLCQETHRQILEETDQSYLHMDAIKRMLLNRWPEILS